MLPSMKWGQLLPLRVVWKIKDHVYKKPGLTSTIHSLNKCQSLSVFYVSRYWLTPGNTEMNTVGFLLPRNSQSEKETANNRQWLSSEISTNLSSRFVCKMEVLTPQRYCPL